MDMDQIGILIGVLEAMGFSKAQATEAVYGGGSSAEAAINWLFERENRNGAQMPERFIDINGSFEVSEAVKSSAQKLRNERKEEDEKVERDPEKEKIRSSERHSSPVTSEGQRKRCLAQMEADREEERKARERIRQKLQQDKLERRGVFGLANEAPSSVKPEKTNEDSRLQNPALLPSKFASIRDRMQKCLRSLKRQTKNDHLKATVAFQTLWIYVKNVVNNPDEEKFRRIRISNPVFQDRIGKFAGGIEFLVLCSFERDEDGAFLLLPREKVNLELLKLAALELQNACSNPFFGLLSSI